MRKNPDENNDNVDEDDAKWVDTEETGYEDIENDSEEDLEDW